MELKDTAKDYNGVFGFNILPLKDKRPALGSWERWQNEAQTREDINKMGWLSATGVGGVSGIGNICKASEGNGISLTLLTSKKGVFHARKKAIQWRAKNNNLARVIREQCSNKSIV